MLRYLIYTSQMVLALFTHVKRLDGMVWYGMVWFVMVWYGTAHATAK